MKHFSLVGQDGNAYSLMGYVSDAMRTAYYEAKKRNDEKSMKWFDDEARKAVMNQAMSGDYTNLLVVLSGTIEKVNDYMSEVDRYNEEG